MSSEAAPLPDLTTEYMHKMYPGSLELVQAQIFFRHGERTPIKNSLFPTSQWLFCRHANYLHSEFMKAINRFVPRHESMPVPNPEKIGQDGYTKRTATLKPGLEYEPAHWSVRLSQSTDISGNDFQGSDKEQGQQEWHQDRCDPGQLTDVGLDTLYRTGTHLRSLYAENLRFIPSKADKMDWLYIRATDYSRVIQSTYALLSGLYPTTSDMWEPMNAQFLARFPIHTRLHRNETLHANFGCPNLLRHFTNVNAIDSRKQYKYIDDIYQQFVQLKSIGQMAQTMIDKPAFGSNFHMVFDELAARKAHGMAIPQDISSDLLKTLGRAAHYQWIHTFHSLEGQRLGFGRLLNEVVGTMKQAAEIEDKRPLMSTKQTKDDLRLAPGGIRPPTQSEAPRVPKLALYAGHDITVAPLAAIFGSTNHDWHPFASMLTIELFKDPKQNSHFVRAQLNGAVLQVPACQAPGKHHQEMGSSMCTMSAFMEHLSTVLPTEQELETECH